MITFQERLEAAKKKQMQTGRLVNATWAATNRETSVASTSTLRNTTPAEFRFGEELNEVSVSDEAMDLDLLEQNLPDESEALEETQTLILATDFGTTFSSVAFAALNNESISSVTIISDYPEDPLIFQKRSLQVPTESCYPVMHIPNESVEADEEVPDENVMEVVDSEEHDNDLTDDDEEEEEADDDDDDDPLGIYGDPGESMDLDIQEDQADEKLPYWGYDIVAQARSARLGGDSENDASDIKIITRSKLMLDKSDATVAVRKQLRPILQQLKARNIINEDEDVIADYLTQLFRHTKHQLVDCHKMSKDCTIEHVLCVPNAWKSQACRKLQVAMGYAVERSGLGSMKGFFLVSEPEAAASYVLDIDNQLNPGEVFVIIDAGGGIVDLTTYRVKENYPLRLEREEVTPTGGLFGSSYLNEYFRKHLMNRLQGEEANLNVGDHTVESLVEIAVSDFENKRKRTLDITPKIIKTDFIPITGLKHSTEKRFIKGAVMFTKSDWYEVYVPVLTGIWNLLEQQLKKATEGKEATTSLTKVMLVGGFSGSPSLKNYLKKKLDEFSQARPKLRHPIRLMVMKDTVPVTAIAHGAVLRAMNKSKGPARKILSSYGFLQTLPKDNETYPALKRIKGTRDPVDGFVYVKNTINWLIKEGDELPSYKEFAIDVEHMFPTEQTELRCEEVLYVSDARHESHYQRSHKRNKGAKVAGRIVADMTFLKEEGLLEEFKPPPGSTKPYYRIEFDLVMIIQGRDLTYEARWPKQKKEPEQREAVEVQEELVDQFGPPKARGTGQISIAAAFELGTM